LINFDDSKAISRSLLSPPVRIAILSLSGFILAKKGYNHLMPKFLKLVLSILLCQGAGIIGSFFTVTSIPTWYATLNKPFFNPPNWLFAPVWTILYALMGIYLYLIWTSNKKEAGKLKRFFLIHLLLNSLWSIVFFGLKSPFGALFIILILVFMIAYLIIKGFKINRYAPYLLMPYLTWVSFATILNAAIWVLN